MRFKYCMIFVLLTALIAGCGGGGSSGSRKPPGDADATAAPYVLQYDDVMEFTRGVESSYNISGKFTGEPEARLTIDGLPEGATYEQGIFTWTPGCDLKPENGQFKRGYLIRRLRINLTSTVSDQVVQRPVIVIVHKDGGQSPCG